jgi:hypothetical protein
MRKRKTDKILNKNKPTRETEENWNLGEDDGRSYESDVDKSIQIFFSLAEDDTETNVWF